MAGHRPLSRRAFLKRAGLAAGGVLVAGASPAMAKPDNISYRVFYSQQAFNHLLIQQPEDLERSHLVVDGTVQEYCRARITGFDLMGANNFNKISSGRGGFGNVPGSARTPQGLHEVIRVVGKEYLHDEHPTIFKGLNPYRDGRRMVWDGRDTEEDLILGPVLVLKGLEEENDNSLRRGIYVHATNKVEELGSPASAGCVRMLYDELRWLVLEGGVQEGSKVYINEDLSQFFESSPYW